MNYFTFRKKPDEFQNLESGVSLYFAVIITSLLLAITLGLSTILISQIKILKEMGDSVIAFFAADTGMEKILFLDTTCLKSNCTSTLTLGSLCQSQMDLVPTTTCVGLVNYSTSTTILSGQAVVIATAAATTSGIIFKSKGIYRETQRAMESTR